MEPAIVKTILVKEFYTNFTNRRNLGLSGPLKAALTLAEDDDWKRIRTVLSPTFTSGKLKEMFHMIKEYSDILVRNMQVYVDKSENCAIKDVLGAYSLDVVTSTAFSVNIDSLNNPNDPFVTHNKKLLKLGLFNPLFVLVVIFPFLGPILERLDFNFIPKDFLDFYMNAVTNFKKKRQKGDHSGRVDFLQLMLDSRTDDNTLNKEQKCLTDEEIMAQSVVFIFAGFEPTSLLLCYLFYNLATHPDVQQKLQEEIDTYLPNKASPSYEILMQMEYLDMVIQETLRMFPPSPRVERISKQTIEVNGVIIPKGTTAMIPVYALHHDPEYWSEPEEFCPKRFSKENRAHHIPYTFLPFGDGPRNCIGMRFVLLSIKVAVTALLQNFSCRPCKDTMIPLEIGTEGFMQPKKPNVLKFSLRTRVEREAAEAE
ncbi:cytochrome P450 3A5-like isoform X2 [Hyperolius riggenbachi]